MLRVIQGRVILNDVSCGGFSPPCRFSLDFVALFTCGTDNVPSRNALVHSRNRIPAEPLWPVEAPTSKYKGGLPNFSTLFASHIAAQGMV